MIEAFQDGVAGEFDGAGELFEATLAAFGLGWDRFFVVPGNHDVHRGTETPAWKRLRPRVKDAPALEVSRWMAGANGARGLGERQREQLLARQAGYREWLVRLGRGALLPDPVLHPHLGYRVAVRLPRLPFDVQVIGLDSAWLCGDDADSGKLLMTADQIGRCAASPGGEALPGFRLALVHHPLSDLSDGAEARGLLADRADLLLRGHRHREEISEWADPDRRLRQVAAGCLYEGWGADEYPNACVVIEVEAGDQGRPLTYDLRLRSWSRQGYWFDYDGLYKGSRGGRVTWHVVPPRARGRIDPRVERVFVGREEELRKLAEHLLGGGEARPVAICAVEGMPGVGKSYLADRFAAEHKEDFPGGYVRLVLDPLLPTGDEALLAQLAERLEVPGSGAGLVARVLARLLRPRTLLHVENVDSAPAVEAAVRLLGKLPGAAVMVTGRVRDLGRGVGWRQVPLATFDEETALQQLWDEIERRPATAAEEEEHRELVRALGFLPLAVHLAAGYLQAGYSVRSFLGRLREQGLEVRPFDASELAAVETSGQARRVLGASFLISHALLVAELGPAAARLLPGLAALGHAPTAGFGRSLGAAIAGLGEMDFDELAARASRLHLLIPVPRPERPDGAWRVHPLLAEFLAQEAEGGEIWKRMTEWFVARLPKAQAGQEEDQGRRWKEIQAEEAALVAWIPRVRGADRARVERAGAEYAWMNGPYRLWSHLCEEALAEDVTPEERSSFLWTLTRVSGQMGDLDRALTAAREKVEHDRFRGAERETAHAQGAIADILEARGDLDEALRIRREEEIPVYERLGDVRSRAVTLGQIADILRARGDLDEALRIRQEEEIPIYERLGDVRERLVAWEKLALSYLKRGQAGDRELAADLLCKALADAERLRIPEAEKIRGFLGRYQLPCP